MRINLKYIDGYAVLERANDKKLHEFATKQEANNYSEHLTPTELTPTEIYDVTWNPRITSLSNYLTINTVVTTLKCI